VKYSFIFLGIILVALMLFARGAQKDKIDPAKEADIRNLIELTGARELLADSANQSVEAYREKLLAALPENDRADKFADEFLVRYKARFNADELTGELVNIYDKHFSAEEIKGLLQFYGSPLGQRAAAEMPQVMREAQRAAQALNQRVTKDVVQELKAEYSDLIPAARGARRRPQP
jgi:hypothetical protein